MNKATLNAGFVSLFLFKQACRFFSPTEPTKCPLLKTTTSHPKKVSGIQ